MFPTFRNGAVAPTRTVASDNRLASLLDHFFTDDFPAPAARPTTAVPLAIWEDESKVHLELDVPGVAEGELDISLHDNVLTIGVERKAGRDGARFDTRRYGKFEQKVSVPPTVDENSVTATLANGVLAVTLTKVPEPKPRKISVNVQPAAQPAPAAEQN